MKLNNISKCFYINLDSNVDRLYYINRYIDFEIERFSAVTPPEFNTNNFISPQEYACFESHVSLWKLLTVDKNADSYFILEDDVIPQHNFSQLWNNHYCKHIPNDFDLIYLGGCLDRNLQHYHKVLQKYNNFYNNIRPNNFFKDGSNYWHMTTEAYIISKKFAKHILEKYNNFDYSVPVDHFLCDFSNEFNFFHSHPLFFQQNLEFTSNISAFRV